MFSPFNPTLPATPTWRDWKPIFVMLCALIILLLLATFGLAGTNGEPRDEQYITVPCIKPSSLEIRVKAMETESKLLRQDLTALIDIVSERDTELRDRVQKLEQSQPSRYCVDYPKEPHGTLILRGPSNESASVVY
jgi:hypothetical protein